MHLFENSLCGRQMKSFLIIKAHLYIQIENIWKIILRGFANRNGFHNISREWWIKPC